jgi:hypothetical protein
MSVALVEARASMTSLIAVSDPADRASASTMTISVIAAPIRRRDLGQHQTIWEFAVSDPAARPSQHHDGLADRHLRSGVATRTA